MPKDAPASPAAAPAHRPAPSPAAAPRPGPAPRRLLDEVVAVVEAQTITLTELEAETRIQLVLLRGAPFADVSLDRRVLAAALRRLVDERIIFAEVERLRLLDLDRADLEKEQARLRARFPGVAAYEGFLRALEMTDDEVGAVLARGLRVARYLDQRLRLQAQLREAELDEAARAEGGGQALARGRREELRERLSREKYEKLLAELIAELRRRAAVRILDPLDGDGPGSGG